MQTVCIIGYYRSVAELGNRIGHSCQFTSQTIAGYPVKRMSQGRMLTSGKFRRVKSLLKMLPFFA